MTQQPAPRSAPCGAHLLTALCRAQWVRRAPAVTACQPASAAEQRRWLRRLSALASRPRLRLAASSTTAQPCRAASAACLLLSSSLCSATSPRSLRMLLLLHPREQQAAHLEALRWVQHTLWTELGRAVPGLLSSCQPVLEAG